MDICSFRYLAYSSSRKASALWSHQAWYQPQLANYRWQEMIVVSCISTCFYFSNILELKWQEEEDHTHIAKECNISDILLNLLLLCSVTLKCDKVFGISSAWALSKDLLFGDQVYGLFSAALKLFVHTFIKEIQFKKSRTPKEGFVQNGHQFEPHQDWYCAITLQLQCTHSALWEEMNETSYPTSGMPPRCCWRVRAIHLPLSSRRSQVLI